MATLARRQDSLARLGKRDTPKMNSEQYQRLRWHLFIVFTPRAFQNSPFMQGVRKTEASHLHVGSFHAQDLCWTFTCDRDEKRKKTDPSFKPTERRVFRFFFQGTI